MKLLLPKTFLKFLFITMLFIGQYSFGQVTIAAWEISGLSAYGASPFAPTVSNTNTTIGGLTRGSGFTTSGTAAGSCWGGNGLDTASQALAITAGDFVTFTIKANTGYKVSLTQIPSYNIRRSGTTASTTGIWQYQIDANGWNDIGSAITWGSNTAGAGNPQSAITLSGITALQNVPASSTISFRIVIWGATATASNWYLNNFTNTNFTPSGPDIGVLGTVAAATSLPTVTTTTATTITVNSASSGGNVTDDGGATVTARGVAFGTATAPTSGTSDGSGTGTYSSSLTSLSLNTQYFYRAYATNSVGTAYGAESNFYTLAATPGVLAVSNPLQTTLDITVNSTTQNSNPAATTYAIQETGGQYVQANGTLGASAVWQTAATWGTITVTGLTSSTLYTFQAKARNSANVETAFGSTASGTTAVAQTVDYAVVQYPNTTQSINEGTNLTVYTRAYEPGLTTLSGSQSNLFAWVGYSSTNDNPSNPGWTWVASTFNAEYGNDDEYQATLSGLPVGTYYYAARFQIGTGAYVYGGSAGVWNNNSVTLNINPIIVDYAVVQFPNTTQNINEGGSLTVYARTYEPGLTTLSGGQSNLHGWIGYSSTNNNPSNSGWTWVAATFSGDYGNDDEYQATLSGLAIGTYYYAARFQIGSGLYVYGGSNGNWNNDNVTLNVNVDVVDYANIQSPSTATITQSNTATIYAQVYEPGVTPGAGAGSGIIAEIGYSSSNTTPNGTWTWTTATYNTDSGNNDEYKVDLGSGLTPGTYYYASRFKKTTSNTYVYGGTGGVWNNDSGVLTVNALGIPTATAATVVGATSFTAKWNAVTDASSYALDVYKETTAYATNLIISEYVEGSSNNKYIEIFNGTGVTVNLANYDLVNYTNGSLTVSATLALSGTLANNSTYVIRNNSATVWGGTANLATTNSVMGYNGNDVIGLRYLGTNIDLVGTIGVTTSFAQDITLTRKSNVFSPTTSYNVSNWTSLATDTVSNLGMHTFDGGTSTVYVLQNQNVGNVISYSVTGLTPETTYHYVVRAVLGAITSGNSNIIDVTTIAAPVIWNGTAWSNTTGPTALIDAIIQGVYSTNGILTAKTLTLTSGSFTINDGGNVTVVGAVINNMTAANFVVENNGNLLQQGTTNNNVGSITVHRNSAAIKRLDYTLWSSPVTGQELYAFSPFTFANRFYTYDSTNNSYSNSVGFSNPIANLNLDNVNGTDGNHVQFSTATGYLIRSPWNHPTTPTTFTGTYVGVPNNGNVTIGTTNGLYYATGNPYPSTIDADQFITDNGIGDDAQNPGDGLYFWRKTNNLNQTTNPTSSYATYTTAGGVASGGDLSQTPIKPNGVIQVGEGFIVKATSTSLVFNNNQRIADNANQFLRTTSIERNRIWLNLSDSVTKVNQMMISYMTGATQGVDNAIDGRYFNDSPTALNSLVNNEEFAIQGRSLPFDATDVVPLAFKAANAGNYTISLDHVDGLFTGGAQAIYLKDNLTNTINDLNTAVYTFASDAGIFNSRFEIIYQSQLGTTHPTFTANNVVIYNQNNDFVVNSGTITMSSIKVFDIRGRLLQEKKGINASQTTISGGLADEVLLVQITSEDGVVVTKKVIK